MAFGIEAIPHRDGYPRFSEAEMDRRHRWIGTQMGERGLEAVVVGGVTGPLETSVQYFSNWAPQATSYLVFLPDEPPRLLVRLWNHLPDAERISVVEDVAYGGDTPGEQVERLAGLLADRSTGRVGLVGAVPHGDLLLLQRLLPKVALVDLDPAYRDLRLVKSEEEMAFTRVGSRMNDAALAALASEFRPGMREHEMARIVESVYLGERGVNLIHFSLTTPMDAPRVPVPHQHPPERTVAAGDVFVTEISTTFWGYAGQVLRTFTMGAEAAPRYRQLHEVALAAYGAIVDVLRPGATVGEVLDAAEVITRAGLDIWDDLVHGFGGAYLPPIVRTRASRGATHPDDTAYPEGSLVVVQPNVIDGSAGVQTGNSMWLTGDGVEVTQQYPMEMGRCG